LFFLQDACAWWPSLGDSITFGPLIVETLALETPCAEATERTFRIMRKVKQDFDVFTCINQFFSVFISQNTFKGKKICAMDLYKTDVINDILIS
jgi:hypothetical protein